MEADSESDLSELSQYSIDEDDDPQKDVKEQTDDLNQSALSFQSEISVEEEEQQRRETFHRPIQLIYIIYSIYLSKLKELAKSYDCQLRLMMNSYIIGSKNGNDLSFEKCKREIGKQVDRVKFIKAEDKRGDEKRIYRLAKCAEVNKKINADGFYFVKFNYSIYFCSNQVNEKQLQEKKLKILSAYQIYGVCFTRKLMKSRMDEEICVYIKRALEYYQSRFQINQIKAQLDLNEKSVNVIGGKNVPAFKMMKVKENVKYIIEGISCVAFRNFTLTPKEQKLRLKYLKKVSDYPIHLFDLNEHVAVLISKDNILRDLLKMREKVKQIFGLKESTQMGMYIVTCPSRQVKKSQLQKCCQDASYDYWSSNGIYYFRKVVKSQSQQNNLDQIFDLVIRILAGFMDVKDKFEVMKKNENFQKVQKKQLEQNDNTYQIKFDTQDSKHLMKFLKRDVIQDGVNMKKKLSVWYNIFQGAELGPYYFKRDQYDNGNVQLIEEAQLKVFKKGQYLQVKFKVPQKQKQLFENDSQELEKAMQIQLNNIKQNIDTQRRIVHLIQKLIIVF